MSDTRHKRGAGAGYSGKVDRYRKVRKAQREADRLADTLDTMREARKARRKLERAARRAVAGYNPCADHKRHAAMLGNVADYCPDCGGAFDPAFDGFAKVSKVACEAWAANGWCVQGPKSKPGCLCDWHAAKAAVAKARGER